MEYIMVRDVDSVVVFVGTNPYKAMADHTEYNETYNGPYEWASSEVTVTRNGVGDYS
jgi:hypothetical protein